MCLETHTRCWQGVWFAGAIQSKPSLSKAGTQDLLQKGGNASSCILFLSLMCQGGGPQESVLCGYSTMI